MEASVGPYVCDFVQRYLIQDLHLTQEQLDHGGYTIQTTLDPELQRSGDAAVLNTLPLEDPRVATFNAVEPGTGHLLALSVNRIFGYDRTDPRQESFNLNVAPSRGAGSTYKVFVAAAALARGYSTSYTQTTSDPYVSRVYKKDGGPYPVVERRALPADAGPDDGALPVVEHLLRRAGGRPRQRRGAGAHGREDGALPVRAGRPRRRRPSTRTAARSPSDPTTRVRSALASAYSTLAAGGTQCDVNPVTAVLDRTGSRWRTPPAPSSRPATGARPRRSRRVWRTRSTRCCARTWSRATAGQTAARAYVPGHQIAGKTGTTQNNFSVAFVGYTPEITASVMVFDPKRNRDVGGFGGGKGATVWHDAMAPILQARGSGVFPPADPKVVDGNTKPVPGCSTVSQCRSVLARGGLPDHHGEGRQRQEGRASWSAPARRAAAGRCPARSCRS